MSDNNDFFLSRQPIIGPDLRFMGWELVLGSASGADLSLDAETNEAYAQAFARLSTIDYWDTLLCGGRAVLRADRSLLFSPVMSSFPRNRIVLALPADFEPDSQASSRLHVLHRQWGMRLLFDAYIRKDPRESLLELADIVHVDTQTNDEATQNMLVRRAKRRDLTVLARGVDTNQAFRDLQEIGFDYFQGQHYADETAPDESRRNVDGQMLLNLMLESRAGLDLSEVSERIEAHAHLSEGLLQLVNGLDLARAHRIDSIHQALIMIGADGLGRWLNLLLFRYGAPGGERGPLFRVAASRARLMELLVTDGVVEDPNLKEKGETAFLVGMLSFVHVLLGESAIKTVKEIGLPQEMSAALLEQRGPLGRILALATSLDSARFAEVAELVAELSIDPARLWQHQRDAYGWVYQMA